MANGKIRFGKQSGGTLGLVFPDGVGDTEVVLPESGTVATEGYVKNNSDISAMTSYSQISGTNTISAGQLLVDKCTFIYPKGLTSRGYVKSSDLFTGSVPTTGVSDGWKYVAKDENNNFSFYTDKPSIGKKSSTLYLKEGKLYKQVDDTPITPISFLSNKVRFASGVPVELAPSDISKTVTESLEADEVLSKNACTAWVNFDGTTTPPTIRDSYNVSTVIRTLTGVFDIYFKEVMDNTAYSVCPSTGDGATGRTVSAHYLQVTLSKVTVVSRVSLGSGYDTVENHPMSVTIFGGKN